ncbi:MAG: GxxExxY protein [Flavisolibacter sp.]
MTENELAKIVVDVCYKIHQRYGPGLLESVYEEIVSYELRKLNLKVSRQVPISLSHEDLYIKVAFRADLIVNEKLLLELKAVDDLPKVYYKKTVTYLKLTNIKLGLLINFSVPYIKEGIHRIVNNLD